MKRRSRLIVGVLAASFTFAALSISLGTDHWSKRGHYYHHGWHHGWHYDCHDHADVKKDDNQPSDEI
jgi:hypothetical protein